MRGRGCRVSAVNHGLPGKITPGFGTPLPLSCPYVSHFTSHVTCSYGYASSTMGTSVNIAFLASPFTMHYSQITGQVSVSSASSV